MVFFMTQVDTPVRKLLLGIAVAYTAIIVVLPFLNVFYQVLPFPGLEQARSDIFTDCVKASCLQMTVSDRHRLMLQAFGNGFGPFLEHLQDEDFLHAVCRLPSMSMSQQCMQSP